MKRKELFPSNKWQLAEPGGVMTHGRDLLLLVGGRLEGSLLSRMKRCTLILFRVHRSLHSLQHLALDLIFQGNNHVTRRRHTLWGKDTFREPKPVRPRRKICQRKMLTSWIMCSLTCFSRLASLRCLISSFVNLPFMLSNVSIASSAMRKDHMSKVRKENVQKELCSI